MDARLLRRTKQRDERCGMYVTRWSLPLHWEAVMRAEGNDEGDEERKGDGDGQRSALTLRPRLTSGDSGGGGL